MKTLDVIVHAISLASAASRSNELRAAAGGALPPSWPANPATSTRSRPRTSARQPTGSPSAVPAPAPELLLGRCPGVFGPRSPPDRRPARRCPGLAPSMFFMSAMSRRPPGQ
ncbi:hypothetical protein ACW4TU_25625 [Streptomyces sp. QTS52]